VRGAKVDKEKVVLSTIVIIVLSCCVYLNYRINKVNKGEYNVEQSKVMVDTLHSVD
jgi:hypothetical protein